MTDNVTNTIKLAALLILSFPVINIMILNLLQEGGVKIRMSNFDSTTIQNIWKKAQVVLGYDPNVWRKDFAGAWIRFNAYGETSLYGWEIDHRQPIAKGGEDEEYNLYPVQWQNNRTKGDDYPHFETSITSEGNINIEKQLEWVVSK